jgi:hypothetical protein
MKIKKKKKETVGADGLERARSDSSCGFLSRAR